MFHRFKVNSLEEAERQMDSRTRIAFPAATSRLAALVAQGGPHDSIIT